MNSAAIHEHHLATARRTGWVAAPKHEVARLVEAGLIERISGIGRGMGNTPCWGLTGEARAEHAERRVLVLGTVCSVAEELPGKLVVIRKGERVTIPESLAKEVVA